MRGVTKSLYLVLCSIEQMRNSHRLLLSLAYFLLHLHVHSPRGFGYRVYLHVQRSVLEISTALYVSVTAKKSFLSESRQLLLQVPTSNFLHRSTGTRFDDSGLGFEGGRLLLPLPIWFCLLTRHLLFAPVCGRFLLVCEVTKSFCLNCL